MEWILNIFITFLDQNIFKVPYLLQAEEALKPGLTKMT